MSDPESTGQVAPAVHGEAQNPESTTASVESQTSATEGEGESAEPQVEKTFTQSELNEIVQKQKAKVEARAERRATQAYREALESVTRAQQPATRASTEPTRENFASDAEWIDAKVDHKLAQRDYRAQAEAVQSSNERLVKSTESIYAEAEKMQGFDRQEFDELPLTRPLAEALIESKVAAQLMVYMVRHPEEVERISKLSAVRQGAEIGKLETKLEVTAKKSTVPAPIVPIGSKGSTNPTLANADFSEYKKQRIATGAKWAR